MTRIQCQGGSILGDVRREGGRQNWPGGEKRLPPFGELFQVPKLRFWGKNTWIFFLFCTIARVLFYECYGIGNHCLFVIDFAESDVIGISRQKIVGRPAYFTASEHKDTKGGSRIR